MKNYVSVSDAVKALKERGYESEFDRETNSLYCSDLDVRLFEDEFHIDETYQIKKDADHAHNAIVYAFTSPTGVKGTIVDEFDEAVDAESSSRPPGSENTQR